MRANESTVVHISLVPFRLLNIAGSQAHMYEHQDATTGNRRTVLVWASAAGAVIFFTLLAIMRGNRKRAALVMKAQR